MIVLKIKKRWLGPIYRKFVRPLIRKYKIKKIDNIKIKKFQGKNLDDIKLIGFLQIHNESKKENLERVLNHLSKFCDDIVIYDDGSTDNSIELALKYTKNIIIGETNDFQNELEHKQQLLNLALSLNPDWIIWLDADEVFDKHGEMYGIRALCNYGDSKKIDGFSFQEFNLWKSTGEYRVDELWHKLWQVRLWKNNGKLKFLQEKGLHRQIYPLGLNKILRSDFKVIHYGFSSEEKLRQKYEMYKKAGQTGRSLERFYDENGIKLKKFSRDWFPLSTQKIVVICLIYKSIGYTKFVLDSFKKYTKNVEFLFIANDATDTVKNFLKDNKINHLIFENQDKNEYYINRIYKAYNYGAQSTNADIIVFVNSDMAFSSNWIKNLLRELTENRIVTSRLIESGKLRSGKYAISKNFGTSYKEFNDENFQQFVHHFGKRKVAEGGLFMPCAIYRDTFLKSGGYPHGNRQDSSGKITSGDRIFFYEKLKSIGVKHYTVYDSLVYHIQEGELDE
jgi:cellulose synthase/poly-beta-1,6-N-acetylglucosamine synthase-like glycosyltransferase